MTHKPRFALRMSTRLVLLTPRRAYKIPLGIRGILQGINERKLWDTHAHTGLLAPLLWSFAGFVCMERVENVKSIPVEAIAEAKAKLPVFQFSNCDLFWPANWGWHEGRLVLLDYGITKGLARFY